METNGNLGVAGLQLYQSEEIMNPIFWSMLPDSLQDIILAALPLRSLCRFRTVSKLWNTRIPTIDSGTTCREPWFFFFSRDWGISSTYFTSLENKRHLRTYDWSSKKWHNQLLCPSFTTETSLAADGGLVCYFSYCIKTQCESILVSNPLTKSCRILPPLPENPTKMTMLAMVVDKVNKTYKVVAAGDELQNKAHVYDSRTERWTPTGNIPASQGPNQFGVTCPTVYFGKPVFSDGVLYVWHVRRGNLRPLNCDLDYGVWNLERQKLRLLTCDLDKGIWSELQAPMPVPVRFGELLEWQSRILMIGVRLEILGGNTKFQSICIWEFQQKNLNWIEVDQMPLEVFESFLDVKDYFKGVYRQGLTVVPCQAGQFVYLFTYNSMDFHMIYRNKGRCKWLMFDLSNRTWQKPLYFSQAEVFGKNFVEGIFYEPTLDAIP